MTTRKRKTKRAVDDDEFGSVHRHWMWADIMRRNFDDVLRGGYKSNSAWEFYSGSAGCYMCMWYALLFGVLDFVKTRGMDVPGIQEFDSIFAKLRLFRNAVFHPQPKYFSPKLMDIIRDENSASEIRKVHDALGEYLWKQMHIKLHQMGEKGK